PSIQPLTQTSSGQIGSVTLPDNTKMMLAPETRIYVPDGFAQKHRALRVEGAASFEVAPNEKLPFHVVAKHMHVIATGTKFVVSAFPTDSGIRVQVIEGAVTLKAGKQESKLSAGQAVVVENGATRTPTPDEQAEAFAWVNNQVVQKGNLRHVVDGLTRWFNFDVKVPDLDLLTRDAKFSVPLGSSRLAISQVEESAHVKFA